MRELRELALVDLNLLPKFRALYRRRSVSAAAHDLHLTQSAVSNALAKMRSLFHDELFVRTPLGMEPTVLAHALAEPVEAGLAAFEGALQKISSFSPTHSARTFRLAMSPLAETWLMPHLLAIAEREAPNVTVISRPCADSDAETAAYSGLCDFAVGTGLTPSDSQTCEQLGTHDLVCMARRNHPVLRAPFGRESLDHCTFAIAFELGHGCEDLIETMSRFVRADAVRFKSTSIVAIPYVVQQTDLVAIVPSWFAIRCSATFDITWVSAFEPALVVTRLFRNATHRNDAGHDWMRDVILRAVESADYAPSGTSAPTLLAQDEGMTA